MNIFGWSESFDFPASWAEESEDRLTRQFKPEFRGCSQRKRDTKRPFDQTCILDRALTLIPFVRDRSRETRALFCLLFFFKPRISIVLPRNLPRVPFTSGPGTRSYRKSVLRWTGRRRNEGTGKGTWKWKATFRASRCGEGPPATKDDRTLRASARAHRDRHVLFKVTGPPTPHSRPFAQWRPGALYWNSADRLSWLCESAHSLFLSLSLLTTRPLDDCENMFKRDCSVILGRFYFGGLFKPSKCDLCPSCYKNCNDTWINNVEKTESASLTEILLFQRCVNHEFYILRLFKISTI